MGRAQTAGQPHGGSPSRRVPGGSSPGGQEWAGIRISLSCHWLGAAGGKCGLLSRKVVPGAVMFPAAAPLLWPPHHLK